MIYKTRQTSPNSSKQPLRSSVGLIMQLIVPVSPQYFYSFQNNHLLKIIGIYGEEIPSIDLEVSDFDKILHTNARGTWLCARQEIKIMMKQEPLPTHDGRPGNRGAIVNLGSNLALVSKGKTRTLKSRDRPDKRELNTNSCVQCIQGCDCELD